MTHRGQRDLVTIMVAVVALAPGFSLPFLLSSVLGGRRSDLLLLSTSVALTLMNVVGNAVEANTVSEVGRTLGGSGTGPGRPAMAAYQSRVMRFVVLTSLGVGPILIALYAARSTDAREFISLAAVMLMVPLLGGLASVRSGEVIAHGHISLAISLQAGRSLVPIALVLAWRSIPLVLLAVGFAVGELTRLLCLTVFSRRYQRDARATARLPTNGLLWQSASALTSQAGPVTDRVFLTGAPVGSISAYEMADKLFFAAVQLMNLGFLVRRVSGWARLPTMTVAQGYGKLRRDILVLLGAATLVGLAGASLVLVTMQTAILPQRWHQGLLWSAILLTALPMSVAVMAGGRLLIVARRQDLLMRFAVFTALANALLDAIFFVWLGSIGIPIATALSRFVSAALYAVVVRRLLVNIVEVTTSPTNSNVATTVA